LLPLLRLLKQLQLLSPSPSALVAIAIALAALALALFLTHQPCCHRHHPRCCHPHCLPTTLVAIALAAIATPRLPFLSLSLPLLVDCFLTHHCHCSANAFANAATSRRAFISHSPGWLLCGFSSRHNLLTCHCLLMRRLVVVLPLVAPPSHLPRLVVTLPLFAPPLPLNALAAAS
jgi:hypothetical protein